MTYTNPVNTFLHWEKSAPTRPFLKQPLHGQWKTWTYQEAGQEIRKFATALRALQLPEKSKIAILSKNCAEWIMADLAIWMAGHVSVPIYPTLGATTIRQILEHSESKVIIIGKLDNFSEQESGIPASIQCISISVYGISKGLLWNELVKNNSPLQNLYPWNDEELATIKYTSGTTGKPKGVMINFRAFSYVIQHALAGFGIPPHHQDFFSYLPLSHIAERMLVEMASIYLGASISFSESLEKFPDNLKTTQPTIFLAVPRIWAKFQEKILQQFPQKKLDRILSIPLVSSLFKSILKKKLGLSRAVWIFTGAAPISKDLLEWWKKLGIVIHEAYGMTENLAFSHTNVHRIKFGTVGTAWPEAEVRISDEGEIQTRHPGTMMGYYKEPQLTAEVFTTDGFLRTGDQGSVDAEGFTTITGRVKDLFKTDKGKYIAPAPIETELLTFAEIEQCCVVGMGIPQPIALIILSAAGKSLPQNELAKKMIAVLQTINTHLDSHERLEKAVIMKEDWTIENGLITPTLKVKRNEIEKIHLPKYPMWYQKEGLVVWE